MEFYNKKGINKDSWGLYNIKCEYFKFSSKKFTLKIGRDNRCVLTFAV